jgi:hypothetical protein
VEQIGQLIRSREKRMTGMIFRTAQRTLLALATVMMLFSFRLDGDEDESTLKALFIYNFSKHVEWPKGKISGKFTIGVLGNTPVFDKLNQVLKDRKIKDLPVEIRKITSNSEVEMCDILFIARSENDRLKDINEKEDCYGVLIVTEEKDMAKKGACINIIEKDERMKFEINDIAIKREGLKISSQLYELAIIVK